MVTLAKEQCVFSARYVSDNGQLHLCKTHADMAKLSMPSFKIKLIKASRVLARD
jgi:hypothetical protein